MEKREFLKLIEDMNIDTIEYFKLEIELDSGETIILKSND